MRPRGACGDEGVHTDVGDLFILGGLGSGPDLEMGVEQGPAFVEDTHLAMDEVRKRDARSAVPGPVVRMQ